MQLVVFFILVMFILVAAGYSKDNLMFGFVVCLILSPLVWRSYEYAIMRRYKRDVLKQHKNKIGSFTLNLSEEELIKESQNLTEKIQWNDLNRFTEDEERYFLYTTDLSAITIMKEPDNMNEEEIMEYQAFIKRKVNG